MADDSLIEEMRNQIKGDRERAEQRRRERQTALAVQYAPSRGEPRSPDEPEQVAVATEPEPEVEAVWGRVGRLRWLRRRHD